MAKIRNMTVCGTKGSRVSSGLRGKVRKYIVKSGNA